MARIGGLQVSPLCFGGNVFSWTADGPTSFALLDAFAAAGGNFVDTADVYGSWVPGQSGGESEAIIGDWMAARGNRDDMVIATKVGQQAGLQGLGADTIRAAAEQSLRRLRTDHIDLYYAHVDDEGTPQEETLEAFDALVREGKVREIGASNFSASRLASALALSDAEGLARYAALQPPYNLLDRAFEDQLQGLCAAEGIACVPYYALASGVLSGKYRDGDAGIESERGQMVAGGVDARAHAVVDAVAAVAAVHEVSLAAVAVAWLAERDTVAAPIASARTVEQLGELMAFATLALGDEDVARLDAASAA